MYSRHGPLMSGTCSLYSQRWLYSPDRAQVGMFQKVKHAACAIRSAWDVSFLGHHLISPLHTHHIIHISSTWAPEPAPLPRPQVWSSSSTNNQQHLRPRENGLRYLAFSIPLRDAKDMWRMLGSFTLMTVTQKQLVSSNEAMGHRCHLHPWGRQATLIMSTCQGDWCAH